MRSKFYRSISEVSCLFSNAMSRLIAFDYPSFSGSTYPERSMFNDLWSTDPWADRLIPRRLLDQNFGLGLLDDDLFLPQVCRGVYLRPKRQQPNQQSSGMSEVDMLKILYNVDFC